MKLRLLCEESEVFTDTVRAMTVWREVTQDKASRAFLYDTVDGKLVKGKGHLSDGHTHYEISKASGINQSAPTTIRGYWVPSSKFLSVYAIELPNGRLRQPDDDTMSDLIRKMDVMPHTVACLFERKAHVADQIIKELDESDGLEGCRDQAEFKKAIEDEL